MKMIFCWVVCLVVVFLFMGCDEVFEMVIVLFVVQVLEGKMMGIFWWVSVVGIDVKCVVELQIKIQIQFDVDDWLFFIYKNDFVLMCFNYLCSFVFWLVSEVMVDIVILVLCIGVKMDGVMDIIVGLLVNLWGFGLDWQLLYILMLV